MEKIAQYKFHPNFIFHAKPAPSSKVGQEFDDIVCIIHDFGLLSALLFLEYYIFRLGKLILVSYQYSLFSGNIIQHRALHLERVRQAAGASVCRASCFLLQSALLSFGSSPLFHPGYYLLMAFQKEWDALHHPDIIRQYFSGSNESTGVCTVYEALF